MAYTLASIRNRVITDKLDDPQYDPTVVDGFINDAQRSIFNTYELPFMEKTFSGTSAATEWIFDFPVDYQVQNALILVGPDNNIVDLTDNYIDFRAFNQMYPSPGDNPVGRPNVWTTYGNKLYYSRPLDQDYQVTLYYLKTPTLLDADGDVPEIPESFGEVLILGAYYRVLERNEDFDLALFYKNGDYQDELDKMVSRLGRRQTGTPTIMAQPRRGIRTRRVRV